MNERTALRALKRKDEEALKWLIDRYSAYVSTIVYNIIGSSMSVSDIEEVTSDVFMALWSNADRIHVGKVKAYLSSVARNTAIKKTREMGRELELSDDVILLSDVDLERDIERKEQAVFIKKAVLALEYPDREIFLRHYYYIQSVAQISEEMGINASTIKTKLRRGREKLKEILLKGGYGLGEEDIGYDGSYTGRFRTDSDRDNCLV